MSKKKNLEKVAEERELILEETNDFEIVIEQYVNQRSVTGVDLGYGIRNKRTGVIEMRWGAYAEALQGLMLLQESLDKFQSQFEAKQGKLH